VCQRVCERVQAGAGGRRRVQAGAGACRRVQARAGACRRVQAGTGGCRRVQAGAGGCRRVQAGAGGSVRQARTSWISSTNCELYAPRPGAERSGVYWRKPCLNSSGVISPSPSMSSFAKTFSTATSLYPLLSRCFLAGQEAGTGRTQDPPICRSVGPKFEGRPGTSAPAARSSRRRSRR
jgi:hypothetical protein